ncbi:hypothetical protein OTB20_05845 [Streptomyces sp. H27-H1]|uniref:hypothetical protein n=1 Tax=unclassified Streptomyces TaxID=2593676 RepID=UPI00226DFBBB|nr:MULTISPECIES: hypothetical protein [unclassified Streptomyces]MCY0925735.1 hypothetical protein [Streptomyces sp. H27-H1]MCY0935172.1 hypothetical protein [Streptomyces sp. H34-S4]
MTATNREQTPVVVAGPGAEVRVQELGGGYSVAFGRFDKGVDMTPAFKGLPDDLCPCPHYAYVLKGRIKMHTKDGEQIYSAGDACYWEPGHAPEALEDTEYLDFSPTEEFQAVIDHVKAQLS